MGLVLFRGSDWVVYPNGTGTGQEHPGLAVSAATACLIWSIGTEEDSAAKSTISNSFRIGLFNSMIDLSSEAHLRKTQRKTLTSHTFLSIISICLPVVRQFVSPLLLD
jgi:hypothetical protein